MTKSQKIRADRKAEIERVLNEAIAEAQGVDPSEIWQNFPWTSTTEVLSKDEVIEKDITIGVNDDIITPLLADSEIEELAQLVLQDLMQDHINEYKVNRDRTPL